MSILPTSFFDQDACALAQQLLGKIIQTSRLGIPAGRDEQLLYRFIDFAFIAHCTSNPQTKRKPVPWFKISLSKRKN